MFIDFDDDVYVNQVTIPEIRNYIKSDAQIAQEEVEKQGYKCSVSYDYNSARNTESEEIVTRVLFSVKIDDDKVEVPAEYVVSKSGEIYSDVDGNDIAENAVNRHLNPEIFASTKSRKTKITAAEDDYDFAEDVDDFSDTVDDLSDTVDDLKDAVDDDVFDPDEPNIEMDNNISGHYIAECDRCHGIFISAVIESDQEIDTISGVCPVCNKDTEQHLKWVIKDVNNSEDVK